MNRESNLGAVVPFTLLPCKAPPVRLHLDVSPEVTCDHAREHVLECVEDTLGAGRRWGSLKERWRGCGKKLLISFFGAFLTFFLLVSRAFAASRRHPHAELAGLVSVQWSGLCCSRTPTSRW